MASPVPPVINFQGMDPSWVEALKAALADVNALSVTRAAITLTASWTAYGSSWSTPQVSRWGRVVIANGLAKTVAAQTAPITIGTVPVGFRPRAVGSVAPLGGRILTTQFSGTSVGYRVDFLDNGSVVMQAGPATIAIGGYLSLSAVWITD